LKSQPDSLEDITLPAESHLRKDQAELVADIFKRAAEVAPCDNADRLEFVRFLLAVKKPDEALQQVETVLGQ
jgi:hypothetical protein